MISYIKDIDSNLCVISMVGRLAFTVATNFWIIFITRLIYLEKLKPGKYFNLLKFVFKNIIVAYIPSLIVSIFLGLILTITDSKAEENCWKIIIDKNVSDYIIYITCFILPNLISIIVINIYLRLYFKIPGKKWTLFLCFPLASTLFSVYYLIIKIFQFYDDEERKPIMEIPFIIEPVFFGIMFLIIYFKQKKRETAVSSDLTLHDS